MREPTPATEPCSREATWYCANLGDATLALAQQQRVEQLVLAAMRKAGSDADLEAFLRHESNGLHCEVKIYLSPGLARVAEEVGAAPCPKPTPEGLSPLLG